ELSRKQIDDYTQFVAIYGAKGLAYIKIVDQKNVDAALQQNKESAKITLENLQSPILKFIPETIVLEIVKRCNAKVGDILFFGADHGKIVSESLGALRDKLCKDFNLYTKKWAPLWVTDFPMYQLDKEGKWEP